MGGYRHSSSSSAQRFDFHGLWAVNFIWSNLKRMFMGTRKINSWSSFNRRNLGFAFDIQEENGQAIVCDLEGALLKSACPFPYFFLMALEAGSIFRAFLLLLLYPLYWFLHKYVCEAAAMKLIIFVSLAGLKESTIEGVARAVLPKFYLEDLHPTSFKAFKACTRRIVITSCPKIMSQAFLSDYLEAEQILGPELQFSRTGYCKGVAKGENLSRLKDIFASQGAEIGIFAKDSSTQAMASELCKVCYTVSSKNDAGRVPKEDYIRPLIFHDGRLVIRPTPAKALMIFLWLPIGFMLALLRVAAALAPSVGLAIALEALLGITIRLKGKPPSPGKQGVLFVCNHRTLLDPVMLSAVLKRRVTALTYSISRVSEILAPIKTVRLTRCRTQDAKSMEALLRQGDLAVCPEGTTCREPYLLRFSSLFAELTDNIVPVAMNSRVQLFHGTSARGWKAFDPFFFAMNPSPVYEIEFLEPLTPELGSAGERSGFEVANLIQKQLAAKLGFQCTALTRRDKYRMLAGNEGIVRQTSVRPIRLISW